MILALFVLTLVFTLGISLVSLTTSSLRASRRDAVRARALACAEAGVDQAISFLMAGGPDGEIAGDWRTGHPSANPDNHAGDSMWVASPASGETFRLCVRTGSGVTSGKTVITSIGTVVDGGITITRTVKVAVVVKKDNVNCWSNAIFGGVGQAGKSINGNVQIMGSIHLLGDGEEYTDVDGDGHWDNNEAYMDSNGNGVWNAGEPFLDVDGDGRRDSREPFMDANGNGTRDPALTVTDMAEELSGTARVGNNYSSMPAALRALVPNPPTVNYGGETVESLNAKLRVKHGRVNISGSATVGDPNSASNSVKETLDGTYVSDGFGGTTGTGGVSSDNGYANGYDLGDGLVTMPLITYGAYTRGGSSYTNYQEYLRANATVVSGDVTFTKGTAKTISGPKGSIVMDAAGNMTISGIVYIDGNVSFGPSKSRIIYSGSGTIVTANSAYVHCDLLPKTNFPITDALGLVAADKVELATGSGDAQLTMAIAMYAQHKIISNKQSEIAGTMVTSYFSMTNVPRLYQAPELANHLPPGMPGADPIYIVHLNVDSWREQ